MQRQIVLIKQKISRLRQENYIRHKVKDSRGSTSTSASDPKPLYVIEGTIRSHVVKKAEDMEIKKDATSLDNFTFSGTDHVLVIMTRAIPMSLDRYKYHLMLYNRFAPLEEIMESDDEYPDAFIPLADTSKAKSEEIDYKGSFLRRRKQLEKLKKYSAIGKEVAAVEKKMSKLSKKSAPSIEVAIANY